MFGVACLLQRRADSLEERRCLKAQGNQLTVGEPEGRSATAEAATGASER